MIYRHDFHRDGNRFYGRRGPGIEHHNIAHGHAPMGRGGAHIRGMASERP